MLPVAANVCCRAEATNGASKGIADFSLSTSATEGNWKAPASAWSSSVPITDDLMHLRAREAAARRAAAKASTIVASSYTALADAYAEQIRILEDGREGRLANLLYLRQREAAEREAAVGQPAGATRDAHLLMADRYARAAADIERDRGMQRPELRVVR